MPELPDVENFKRYFENTSLNKVIVDIECQAKDLVKEIGFGRFKKKLIGRSFREAWRKGKFLIIEVEGIPEKLAIHFGMTGGFHYTRPASSKRSKDWRGEEAGPGDRFSRLIFKFEDGDSLHWLNMRKLGKVYLVRRPEEIKLLREMGPEPLEISKIQFIRILRKHEGKNIKAFLLDQRDIAGVGNIYSNEILFQAKVNPHRKVGTLNLKEEEKVYQAMVKVLQEAIQIGPPWGRFDSSWLLVHRERDMRCPRNKNHRLKREIIAGRAAIYCPICQK